uniref:MalT-like TPR region domain-containing protein n=1 Tax=Attheya septentrionalis TaxID=420275 RepID=A0A7S2XIW8_9STRA|mmetsp:Transcript_12978/g.23505  ORF Transcript_12978/g.23505 Transcript_12978/m.23505 type:complete len:269 (+) Transcript_12978:225-1031(+)
MMVSSLKLPTTSQKAGHKPRLTKGLSIFKSKKSSTSIGKDVSEPGTPSTVSSSVTSSPVFDSPMINMLEYKLQLQTIMVPIINKRPNSYEYNYNHAAEVDVASTKISIAETSSLTAPLEHKLEIESYESMLSRRLSSQEYEKVLVTFEKALELEQSLYGNDHSVIIWTMHGVAMIMRDQRYFQDAITTLKKALNLALERTELQGDAIETAMELACLSTSIANIYRQQERMGNALFFYNAAVQTLRAVGFEDEDPKLALILRVMERMYT